jgi:hypothetical protein
VQETIRPFFDTRDVVRLRLATNLVTYSHEFCRHERNRNLLIGLEPTDEGVTRLVHSLERIQHQLASYLPLAGSRTLWTDRIKYLNNIGIETALDVPSDSSEKLFHGRLEELLNTRMLEGLLDQMPHAASGVPKAKALQLATASSWLSDHLALIVLRIAVAHFDQATGVLTIAPAGDSARKHMRRVWFGNALEQQSLNAMSMTLQAVAHAAVAPASYVGDRQLLFFRALSVFPQHWRLPPDSGPVAELLEDYLIPLTRILINVTAAHAFSQPAIPYQHAQAAELDAGDVFELVREMQATAPLMDRLFDIEDGGLVLGPRALAPGAIAIAEHFAKQVIGKDWHGKVSAHQKRYVLERVSRCAHVTVLDFELRQHDTSQGVPLDVDFMVRDELHGTIYAVQLKHFQNSDKSGVLYWISRFRERDKSLGKAVQQLENLLDLLNSDEKIRSKLTAQGVSPQELDRIVPVVLHNVGALDFWELQSGVHLYDISTFCNVLDGRSSTFVSAAGGQISTGARDGMPLLGSSLQAPETVIAAYLADSDFAALKAFDIAKKAVRTMSIDGESFVAQGLGI